MKVLRGYVIMDGQRRNHRVLLDMDENVYQPPGRITVPNPPEDREQTQQETRNLRPVEYGTPNSTTYRLFISGDRAPDFDRTRLSNYRYYELEQY
jgi:hypothetical protein